MASDLEAVGIKTTLRQITFAEWLPKWLGFESLLLANVLAFVLAALVMVVVAQGIERLVLRPLVNQEGVALLMALITIGGAIVVRRSPALVSMRERSCAASSRTQFGMPAIRVMSRFQVRSTIASIFSDQLVIRAMSRPGSYRCFSTQPGSCFATIPLMSPAKAMKGRDSWIGSREVEPPRMR